MYIHTQIHQQQASKNARQLSEQLVEVIRVAKKSNKNLSYLDVCQATRLTSTVLREELGGMSHRLLAWVVMSVLAGVAAAIAFVILNR